MTTTRRVTTPFPTTGEFYLRDGNLPEVRAWLHENGVRWNSGSSVLTNHTGASYLVIRESNEWGIRVPTALMTGAGHGNSLELTLANAVPLTVLEIFTLFLKKKGLYDEYHRLRIPAVPELPVSFIRAAFIWHDMNWRQVDEDWQKLIKDLEL